MDKAKISDLISRVKNFLSMPKLIYRFLADLETAANVGPLRQLIGMKTAEHIRALVSAAKNRDIRRLCHFESQVFSQNGEDGIIAEIFARIGTTNKFFIEIGVGDGLENNSAFLLWQKWNGIWIDKTNYPKKVRRNVAEAIDSGQLKFHNEFVTMENIENVIGTEGVPNEPDFMSIDIDRNTIWIWRGIKRLRPRVVVVEYNATIPASINWSVDYRPFSAWNGTHYFGASLKAFEKLGEELGYALVGCNLVGINAFFVRKDLLGQDRFVGPFTAEEHHEPPRYYLFPARGSHPRGFHD